MQFNEDTLFNGFRIMTSGTTVRQEDIEITKIGIHFDSSITYRFLGELYEWELNFNISFDPLQFAKDFIIAWRKKSFKAMVELLKSYVLYRYSRWFRFNRIYHIDSNNQKHELFVFDILNKKFSIKPLIDFVKNKWRDGVTISKLKTNLRSHYREIRKGRI